MSQPNQSGNTGRKNIFVFRAAAYGVYERVAYIWQVHWVLMTQLLRMELSCPESKRKVPILCKENWWQPYFMCPIQA